MDNNKSKTSSYLIYSTIVILIATWIYAIYNYSRLPDKIVAHMDLKGNVNRYDDKSIIWILLIVFTGLSYAIYWLSNLKQPKFNRKFNNESKNKLATLMSLPYLAIVGFIVIFMMINKSLNPDFNTSYIMYFIFGLTLVLLISLFTFIFKNIKS